MKSLKHLGLKSPRRQGNPRRDAVERELFERRAGEEEEPKVEELSTQELAKLKKETQGWTVLSRPACSVIGKALTAVGPWSSSAPCLKARGLQQDE